MHQRKTAFGRPSGTDGSDFSYRMVVDPRYTNVAQGKSRLKTLIVFQAVVLLIGALITLFSSSKDETAVLSIAIAFVSLLIGELGRSRSQALFLRLYMAASSVATLLSALCIVRSNILLEVFQGSVDYAAKKFELINLGSILLGMLVEIVAIITTDSLIRNMAPPKRAS